jgi:probable blue pigment (indigoidine) exporter
MEGNWRRAALTAVAPIVWGATYFVTRELLPPDAPLWGAAIRALPGGLILLAIARRLPHGAWWWRSAVLGVMTMGGFFVLVYLAAQLLPTSVASTVMAVSPVVMMLVAWAVASERPGPGALAGGVLGLLGVAAIVAGPVQGIDPLGIVCSVAAMLISSIGFVLARRWRDDTPVLASTAWQLIAGGIVAAAAAMAFQERFPRIGWPELAGYAWLALVAGAVAYLAWYGGLSRLPVAAVGLIGLLNPIVGVLLGVVAGGERLSVVQVLGMGAVLGAIALGQRRRRDQSSSSSFHAAARSRAISGARSASSRVAYGPSRSTPRD